MQKRFHVVIFAYLQMKAHYTVTQYATPATSSHYASRSSSKILQPFLPAMDQDGPHDHQQQDDAASDDHSFAPPTTITYSLSPGRENDNGGGSGSGSSSGSPEDMDTSSKRKDVVVPPVDVVHKEEGGCGSASGSHPESGGSKGKRSAAEVADATADASFNGFSKGKSLAAASDHDDGDGLKGHTFTERLRRQRLRDMFGALNALMPQVPDHDQKRDKAAIVGDAITYIKELQKTVAVLEKRKKEQELARQAAAGKTAVAYSSSSSSSAPAPALTTAHGMAAMFSEVPQVQQRPDAAAAPPPAGTAAPLVETAGPAGFRTWSAWNVVLSVSNDDAHINVCAPRRPGMLTLLLSVLNKYGIDVLSVHVAADGVKSLFSIYAHVKETDGENPSSEDVYKLAVSEIMVWLIS